MSKTTWTAAMWREKRRQNGVSPKSDMPTQLPAHIFTTGRQLNAMMMLPALDWPKDLFAVNSTAPLLKKIEASSACACGCGFPHHLAVSRVVGDVNSRRVFWYRTMRCKSKHMSKDD